MWFHAGLCVGSGAPDWHKLAAERVLVLQRVLASVCQSYLPQQYAMGGWTLLHRDPINFISARHTFRHARSVRRGSGGMMGVEVSGEASGNNWERGSGRMGQAWESLNFPYLLFEFLHGEKKMQLHVPSQPFQASVVCKNWGGSGGVCALWRPALPYSMLIVACSAF